jgi:hypothetical protein
MKNAGTNAGIAALKGRSTRTLAVDDSFAPAALWQVGDLPHGKHFGEIGDKLIGFSIKWITTCDFCAYFYTSDRWFADKESFITRI